ncbi:MAG TPA: hypothetical protein VGJ05_07240 [Fimbriiglobus sp.]
MTELARLRLEVISFFLLAFFLSAGVVRWVWNGLARDFPRLPRFSYGRALGVVAVWGALFVLVLTMIAGARELMTPGAWKPNGMTYKLAETGKPTETSREPTEAERRRKLDELRAALWKEASGPDKVLPPSRAAAKIPEDVWKVPHASGTSYIYIPGRKLGFDPLTLVAAEPDLFVSSRYGLFSDGSIRAVTAAEIEAAFGEKGGK